MAAIEHHPAEKKHQLTPAVPHITSRSFAEIFAQDDFDAHAFVTKYLAAAPSSFQSRSLETLRTELRGYGEKLKSQLVDLLNREYADFIGLASGLLGTSESIQAITSQLSEVQQRVQKVHDHVFEALRLVDAKLDERKVTCSRLGTLETLHEIHQSVRRMKSLLAMCKPLPKTLPREESKSDFGSLSLSVGPATVASPRALQSPTLDVPSAATTAGDSVSNGKAAMASADPVFELFQQLLSEGDSDVSASVAQASSMSASTSPAVDDALAGNAVLMERLARQLCTLKQLMRKHEQFELVRDLKGQAARIENEFQEQLSDAFLCAIDRQHEAALVQCLRAFAYADLRVLAEKLVREHVVRPFAQSEVTKEKLAGVAAGSVVATASASVPAVKNEPPSLYNTLLTFVRQKLRLLLTTSGRDSPFYFDFFSNSVWAELVESLSSLGTSLFMVGMADGFHANYTQTLKFIRSLEAMCVADPEELTRFRSHPASVSFRAKWNVPVYFSLRFQHIAVQLESAVAQPLPATIAALSKTQQPPLVSGFAVPASAALWKCLHQCWADDVWIEELTPRFFKLSLQLLARYLTWLEQGLGLATTSTTTSASAAWPDVDVNTLVLVQVDSSALLSRLPKDFLPVVLARLRPAAATTTTTASAQTADSKAAEDAVRAGFDDSLQRLTRLLPAVKERIAGDIARKCNEVLQLEIPRIKTTYRLTQKKPPTAHSAYVPDVLSPLIAAVIGAPATTTARDEKEKDKDSAATAASEGTAARSLLSAAEKRALLANVVNQVADKFVSLANELLTGVKAIDATLRKMKTKTAASAAAAGAAGEKEMSDLEKMQLQLYFDAVELAKRAKDDVKLSEGECAGLEKLRKFAQTMQQPEAS